MKAYLVLAVVLGLASGAAAADKPRVFITDSDSWEMSGHGGVGDGIGVGGVKGGARPQRVEIMKTFSQRCPGVTITLNREKADFVVLLDHEGGKDMVRRDNKVAVFDRNEDMLHTGSTRSLGNAVKDACSAIFRSRTP